MVRLWETSLNFLWITSIGELHGVSIFTWILGGFWLRIRAGNLAVESHFPLWIHEWNAMKCKEILRRKTERNGFPHGCVHVWFYWPIFAAAIDDSIDLPLKLGLKNMQLSQIREALPSCVAVPYDAWRSILSTYITYIRHPKDTRSDIIYLDLLLIVSRVFRLVEQWVAL